MRQHLVSSRNRVLSLCLAGLGIAFGPACDDDSSDGDSGAEDSGGTGDGMNDSSAEGEDTDGEDSTDPGESDTNDSAGMCEDSADAIYGSDCQEYIDCAQANCTSAYEQCLGPNFQSGDFSGGSCQAFMECTAACDCNDQSCSQACFDEHFAGDCQSCLTNDVGTCVATSCYTELAACG